MVWVFYFFLLEGFWRGPTVNPKICGTKSEVKPFKRCELWLHVLWCLPQKPKTPRIVKLSAELEFNILKCCASNIHFFDINSNFFHNMRTQSHTLSTIFVSYSSFLLEFFSIPIFLFFVPLPNLGGSFCLLLESSTTKGSKICFSSSEEHPIPVSCTVRQFSPNSVFSQRTSTWRRDWSKAVISENYVELFLLNNRKQSRGTCWVPIIWIETMRDSCRSLDWNKNCD